MKSEVSTGDHRSRRNTEPAAAYPLEAGRPGLPRPPDAAGTVAAFVADRSRSAPLPNGLFDAELLPGLVVTAGGRATGFGYAVWFWG
jgi:hypothetical protein